MMESCLVLRLWYVFFLFFEDGGGGAGQRGRDTWVISNEKMEVRYCHSAL